MSNKLSLRDRMRQLEARNNELEQAIAEDGSVYTPSQINAIVEQVRKQERAQANASVQQYLSERLIPCFDALLHITQVLGQVDISITDLWQRDNRALKAALQGTDE